MAQVNYSDNGLVFIKKQSGTAVSSISIDNCFTATYSQYKIIFDALTSASDSYSIRMRANGSDNSSTDYKRQYIVAASTSITGGRSTTDTSMVISGSPTIKEISIAEILNPFQSTYTTAYVNYSFDTEGNVGLVLNAYGMGVTTSYDGFSVIPAAGTITGDVYVYGYKES